jgi:hypothetical protein
VFHGIKGDVSVAESSRARDRFLGWSPRSTKLSRYIRPGMMMAMY